MDIDIRIGRFRFSWSPRSSLVPASAQEMEQELLSLRGRVRHMDLRDLDMQDILRRELRGEPEDKPSPHAAKCAADLIRRLRQELANERATTGELLSELLRRSATLAEIADAAGVEHIDDLDHNAIVCAVRSLRASVAPLMKRAA